MASLATPPHAQEGPAPRGRRSEVAAGGGLGLLLGLLVGLSVSPVVTAVVGAVAALLAGFLGLQERSAPAATEPADDGGGRLLRIASFSIACIVGIGIGVAARNHDLLSPGPRQRTESWKSAGYSDEEARAFVAFQTLGLVPHGWTATGQATASAQRSPGTALFAVDAAECERLEPRQYASTTELAKAYKLAGRRWAALADATDALEPAVRQQVLQAAWALACG